MAKPAILTVDDDAEVLRAVERDLRRKYANNYRVLRADSGAAKLTSDIKTSTARISELVGAIKEYTYMDQASVQQVDVHKGLENTLLILKYKLRKKNITLVRVIGSCFHCMPV